MMNVATRFGENSREDESWPRKRGASYLLRRGLIIQGELYPAGTPVCSRNGKWYLSPSNSIEIEAGTVCRASYAGLVLYEVICGPGEVVIGRRALSDEPPFYIEQQMVAANLKQDDSLLCIKFGQCFFPIEFFNW